MANNKGAQGTDQDGQGHDKRAQPQGAQKDAENGDQHTSSHASGTADQQHRQEGNGKDSRSFLAGFTLNQSPAARDPLERYQEILRDDKLTEGHKGMLMAIASRRFQNRQLMAYISLAGIFLTLVVVLWGVIADRSGDSTIIENLKGASDILGVTNGLLTAIVASYFGATSFRPSS